MDVKKRLIIFFFYLTQILIAILSFEGKYETSELKSGSNSNTQELEQTSYFINSEIFVTKLDKPHLTLRSTELANESTSGKMSLQNPNGIFFNNEQRPVYYTADRGLMWKAKDRFYLENNVKLHMDDAEILADRIDYSLYGDKGREVTHATGNVHTTDYMPKNEDTVIVDSVEAYMWPKEKVAKYIGNVSGVVRRKRAYEENIYFKSQELISYEEAMKMDLLGDVWVKKQDFTATSRRGEVFLENYNKKLKYFTLYDDVKVLEKIKLQTGGELERRAFGEKLDGIMAESKYILTGSPKVIQERDIIKGNVIVLREQNEVVEVDDANSNFILK